ncbi:MAG TPA: flagellar biosynthetic protein FliO [Opitutaceae bacterium]
MKIMRRAALLALLPGAVLSMPAADRTGPEPSEIIHPARSPAVQSSAGAAADARVLAPPPMPGGLGQAAAYVVILGLLVGGAWLLMKRGTLARPFSKGSGKLQVLETRMLGNRQFLLVVEYEDAKMLIGVCPGRIDYLTPLAGHPLAESGVPEEEAAIEFGAAARRENS